ncbi:MAG: hypothetical protein AB7E96_05380 [Deferribacterales bacterium]
MKKLLLAITVSAALLLAGCGGGGGGEGGTRLKRIVVDSGANGTADTMYTIVYDSESYMSSAVVQDCSTLPLISGADCALGTVDYTYYFFRDGAKNITTITRTNSSNVTRTSVYTYDANNAPVSLKTDFTTNGSVDYAEYYTTDANGDITSAYIDSDNDSVNDHYSLFTYFQPGKPYHYELNEDYLSVPALDYLADYSYDAEGKVTDVIIDDNADNIKDEYKSYVYEGGKLVRVNLASSYGGTPTEIYYLEYEGGAENGTEFLYLFLNLGLYF